MQGWPGLKRPRIIAKEDYHDDDNEEEEENLYIKAFGIHKCCWTK